MIRDESRSSQPVTPAPLPGGAHPNSPSSSPPKEFPSGPVEGRALLCAVDMEIDPNAMPLYGAANRTRSCGAELCSTPPPSARRRRSRNSSAAAPLRICTSLHYFAPLCSDFGAGPHLKPSQNQSLVFPIPCICSRPKTVPIVFRISVQFWNSFGPVFRTLNSPPSLGSFQGISRHFKVIQGNSSQEVPLPGRRHAQVSTSPGTRNRKMSVLVTKPQKIDFR